MIEYTIKVQRVLLTQGEVLVFLNPTNAEGLEPIRHVVQIPKETFQVLSNMDSNAILEVIREDIVKSSLVFQYKWELQQAAIDAALPASVLSVEGREFPVVTVEEQKAVADKQNTKQEAPQEVVI